MATYPSLGKIDSTADQDLGLTIAFKKDAEVQHTTAQSPEEYLAQFVVAKLEDLAIQHVSGQQLDLIFEALKIAFSNDDVTTINKVATDLNVDITIDPNKP